MKLIVIYLMILTIFLQSLNYALTYFSFTVNREYIAEVLCINKGKPEMKCNGHCQLVKRMKDTESKRENAPVKPDEKSSFYLINARLIIPILLPYRLDNDLGILVCKANATSFIEDIFHPPKSA
jgi:hypothetical protein